MLLLPLFKFEFDDTLRDGMGIDAVVNKGLLIVESILSLSFVSLPNEFELKLLAKKESGSAAGEQGPSDNSKSGEDASNFKKLLEEL